MKCSLLSKLKFLFRALKYRYKNDRSELTYLSRNVKKDDFVLDIGAHKGGYLYWLRKFVGIKGSVIAFEPQPILYNYLNQIIETFGYDNIDLHHAGISSQAGELELFVPKEMGQTSPGATFENRVNQEKGHLINVQVFQLDDFMAQRKRKINFIKLDVEGHELEVFKGANTILQQDQPTLIFECENRHLNGIKVQDVFEYLTALNYEGFFFAKNGMQPIIEFDAEKHQATSATNEIIDKKNYANNFVFQAKR